MRRGTWPLSAKFLRGTASRFCRESLLERLIVVAAAAGRTRWLRRIQCWILCRWLSCTTCVWNARLTRSWAGEVSRRSNEATLCLQRSQTSCTSQMTPTLDEEEESCSGVGGAELIRKHGYLSYTFLYQYPLAHTFKLPNRTGHTTNIFAAATTPTWQHLIHLKP